MTKKVFISSRLFEDFRMTASGDQICFFFIVNIKIRITKYTSTKVYRRNHYPKHVFSWVLLNPRTTDPPANQPPVLTHQPTLEAVVQQNSRIQLYIAWWSLALTVWWHVENEVQHWWYNVAFRHNATLIM